MIRIRWLVLPSKAILVAQLVRTAHHCVPNVVDRAHHDGACGRIRKRGGEGEVGLEGSGRGGYVDAAVRDCQCSFFDSKSG